MASPAVTLSDFSGGLNLRDSANELALNETSNALNWTLDQRGAAQLRKGWSNVASLPGVSGKNAFIFYSEALDLWLCARERAGAPNDFALYTRPGDLSGSWTARGLLSTVTTCIANFVDWPGNPPKAIITVADTAGGGATATYSWDATTFATLTSLGGSCIAVWQNRVWLGGYVRNDVNGYLSTVFASKVGDPATWTAPDGLRVDLREQNASRISALGIAGGALLAFKKRSAYRFTDSSTGSYATIDPAAGSQGPRSIVPLRGRLYTWGADSIYEWDGVGPGRRVGDKARPLFTTDAALVGGVPALCGGAVEDRTLFAYPSAAGLNNDRLLEFDPTHGWLMKHSLASTSKNEISSFASKDGALYAAALDGDVILKVYAATPGADDGTLYASNNYCTPWLQPANGKLARIIRAQLEGLTVTGGTTTLTLRVYKDWDTTSFDSYDVSTDLRGSSANVQVAKSIIRSLGHASSFAFEFVAGTAAGATQVNSLSLDPIQIEG